MKRRETSAERDERRLRAENEALRRERVPNYTAAYRVHEDSVERMTGKRHPLNEEGRALVRAEVDAALRPAPKGETCATCGDAGTTNFPCPGCGTMHLVDDPRDAKAYHEALHKTGKCPTCCTSCHYPCHRARDLAGQVNTVAICGRCTCGACDFARRYDHARAALLGVKR